MTSNTIQEILSSAGETGWVMEPEAKRLLSLAGLDVPQFCWTSDVEEAAQFASEVGYPVVAKVVSPQVLHKSDVSGVAVGIERETELREVFQRFQRIEGFSGVLVETQLAGMELIVGAKIDHQFGPVILLGMGGTSVEVYGDTALRMAPLREDDPLRMVKSLKARPLLERYRGAPPVDLPALSRVLMILSDLVLQIEPFIESIDLNPVICFEDRCVVADARIILSSPEKVDIASSEA